MIRIRRFAACLVALLAAAGASALAAPAAFATIAPPAPAGESGPVTGSITNHPATVHTVLVGGMPGWQIALIAAGAAVLAAALAVLADRLRSARRADPARLGRRAARVGSGSAA
jgi:hypothetical protein